MKSPYIRTVALVVALATTFVGGLSGCAMAALPDTDENRVLAHGAYGAAILHIYEAQSCQSKNPERARELWNRAGALLERARRIDPNEPRVAELLVACYLRQGRHDKAVGLCEELLEAGAMDSRLLLHAATLCANAREYERGLRLCRGFLARQDDLNAGQVTRVLVQLMTLYQLAGRADEGAEFLVSLQHRAPDNAELCKSVVLLLRSAGLHGESQKHAAAFLSQHPGAFQIRLLLADLHAAAGRRDEAAKEFRAVLDTPALPSHALSVTALKVLRFSLDAKRRQDREPAVGLLERLLEPPGNELSAKIRAEIRLQIAALRSKLKDFGTAERMLRELIAEEPTEWRRHAALAETLWDADKREAALKQLRDYAAATPKGDGTRRIRMCLADFLERSGKREGAIAELRKNLAESPEDPDTCNHLGYLYAVWGERLNEAVMLIKKALRVEPENAAFLDSLAWAYYKIALRDDKPIRLGEAGALVEKAARLMPGDPVINDHVGDILCVEGKLAEAVAGWKAALEAAGDNEDRPSNRADILKKIEAVEEIIKRGNLATRPIARPLKPPPTSAD